MILIRLANYYVHIVLGKTFLQIFCFYDYPYNYNMNIIYMYIKDLSICTLKFKQERLN